MSPLYAVSPSPMLPALLPCTRDPLPSLRLAHPSELIPQSLVHSREQSRGDDSRRSPCAGILSRVSRSWAGISIHRVALPPFSRVHSPQRTRQVLECLERSRVDRPILCRRSIPPLSPRHGQLEGLSIDSSQRPQALRYALSLPPCLGRATPRHSQGHGGDRVPLLLPLPPSFALNLLLRLDGARADRFLVPSFHFQQWPQRRRDGL